MEAESQITLMQNTLKEESKDKLMILDKGQRENNE
jgi:hypothetical protein